MTDEQKKFVEHDLKWAIMTFHDCDDKKLREKYTREYFHEFCSDKNINEKEALEMIEKFLKQRREESMFKYEHFTDLKSILYPDNKNLEDEGR